MKPRASIPRTFAARAARYGSAIWRTASANASPEASSGVMSRKRIPGVGKSGTSRMKEERFVTR